MGKEKNTFHACDMPPEVDDLMLIIPGSSIVAKCRRRLRGFCLISATNRRAIAWLHSRSAIAAERSRNLRSHYWVIHPFSAMRTSWELFMCVVLLLSMLVVPFTVTYKTEDFSFLSGWLLSQLVIDVCCMADIILNFSTGTFHIMTQEVSLRWTHIAKQYVCGYFIFDLLSSLPYEIIEGVVPGISHKTVHYITMLNLLKVFRLKSLLVYLKRAMEVLNMSEVLHKLLTTTLFVILYFHWMACMCFLVVLMFQDKEAEGNRSWVKKAKIYNYSPAEQYVHSIYHAVMDGNHVNYPHGAPTTTEDMLFTCVIGFTGTLLFIYVVGTALQILYISNNSAFKYEEDTNQLKEFMRQKQLPEAFQKRLIGLNEFKFQKSFFREKNILNSLPGQLRQEILIHSCRHHVENVSFFNNLSAAMLVRLVMVLKSEIYLKNQEIIKIRTLGDCMYFLSSGTVAVYSASGREVCHMQDGSHFGEMALLNPDRLRTASVVALEISEVYRLDRRDFVLIVAQFPDMVDQLKQIATERQEQLQRIDV